MLRIRMISMSIDAYLAYLNHTNIHGTGCMLICLPSIQSVLIAPQERQIVVEARSVNQKELESERYAAE